MKWDALGVGGAEGIESAERLAQELGIDRSRPLVVAGSTAPLSAKDAGAGCEEGLIDACVGAGVQVLCAPRKPEHFGAAFAALGGAPRCVRRSEKNARASDRFLLDTIGELRAAYALADVVVVGRSFGDLYGSDVMEVAALGKPALIGPSYADFAASVEALRAAGAVEVVDRAGLGGAISRLLGDAGERARRGEAARACVRANQGATARHADLLAELAAAPSVRG
jgi:3-deoxy-D-manno-octulosonic-acid transferase